MFSGLEEVRRRLGGDLLAGVQAVQVRAVPMMWIGLGKILRPLHDLALRSDLIRQQLFQLLLQLIAERFVGLEDLRCCDDVGEQLARDGHVHGRAHAQRAGFFLAALIVRVLEIVLRRSADGRDEMSVAVVDQPRGQEFRGAFHVRIRLLAQEFVVAREQEMLPQVRAEPRPAHQPEARLGIPVHRLRVAPDGGVVMEEPPRALVELLRGLGPADGKLAHHAQQRLGALREIGQLDRPVVHLQVDVGRVCRRPRRLHEIVPDPLKIERLPART